MAKVEMSIQEYDALREELSLYKRALNEILTPSIDDWSLQWFKDHPESYGLSLENNVTNYSRDVQKLVRSLTTQNIPEDIRSLGIFEENIHMNIGRIDHPTPEEKEPEEPAVEETP